MKRLETSNILPICEEKDLQQCKQRNGSSPVCRSKWCFKPIGTLKAVSHSGQTLFLGLPMEKNIYDQFKLLLFLTPFFCNSKSVWSWVFLVVIIGNLISTVPLIKEIFLYKKHSFLVSSYILRISQNLTKSSS